jgi:hypothetical protein
MAQRQILWTVNDPRGLPVTLTDDVWHEHVTRHPEIADYFVEARLTIQAPDEIYFDAFSTARKQTDAIVYAYYRSQLGRGKYADDYVVVSVKFVTEAEGAHGYLQSVLLSNRVMPRLELVWKRSK